MGLRFRGAGKKGQKQAVRHAAEILAVAGAEIGFTKVVLAVYVTGFRHAFHRVVEWWISLPWQGGLCFVLLENWKDLCRTGLIRTVLFSRPPSFASAALLLSHLPPGAEKPVSEKLFLFACQSPEMSSREGQVWLFSGPPGSSPLARLVRKSAFNGVIVVHVPGRLQQCWRVVKCGDRTKLAGQGGECFFFGLWAIVFPTGSKRRVLWARRTPSAALPPAAEIKFRSKSKCGKPGLSCQGAGIQFPPRRVRKSGLRRSSRPSR